MCPRLFTPWGVDDGDGCQSHGDTHEKTPQKSRHDSSMDGGLRKLVECPENAGGNHKGPEQYLLPSDTPANGTFRDERAPSLGTDGGVATTGSEPGA